MRILLLLAALTAPIALVACGGDDDEGGNTPAQTEPPASTTGRGAECIESWTKDASPDVKGYTIAGVSERPVMAGTYKGERFEASTEADSVTVKPGDCVVAQVTTTETEYVFVRSAPATGGAPAWHNLEEEGTPLAAPNDEQLADLTEARLTGYGPEAKLAPAGG